MKKVISYSLYGTDKLFLNGAVKNLELQKKYYPDWIARFYVSQEIPNNIIDALILGGAEIIKKERKHYADGMFWRFLAVEDPNIDVVIIRDCDSFFTDREVLAVKEWIKSEKSVHIMRDHPFHKTLIMGGMWGAKKGTVKNIKESFEKWTFFNRRGADQEFLKYIVYPQIKSNCLIHSDLIKYDGETVFPFSQKREKGEYVAAVYDYRVASLKRIESEDLVFENATLKTYPSPFSLIQKLKSRLKIEINHWYRLIK